MGLGSESVLNSIVHPSLHAALPKFYPTVAAIQAATVTQKANGEEVMTWATFLRDLTGNMAQRFASETRGGAMTRVPIGWALNLAGHYPTITVQHRAVIDGVDYNITAITHDSLSASTRLELERTVH
jgi:hypothetical protein